MKNVSQSKTSTGQVDNKLLVLMLHSITSRLLVGYTNDITKMTPKWRQV